MGLRKRTKDCPLALICSLFRFMIHWLFLVILLSGSSAFTHGSLTSPKSSVAAAANAAAAAAALLAPHSPHHAYPGLPQHHLSGPPTSGSCSSLDNAAAAAHHRFVSNHPLVHDKPSSHLDPHHPHHPHYPSLVPGKCLTDIDMQSKKE